MNSLRKKIGERIRKLRLDRYYSLEELSHRAELNTAHLSKIERGEINFTISTLEKIMDALEITWDELYTEGETVSQSEPYLQKTASCIKALTIQEREVVYQTARLLARKHSD